MSTREVNYAYTFEDEDTGEDVKFQVWAVIEGDTVTVTAIEREDDMGGIDYVNLHEIDDEIMRAVEAAAFDAEY